VGTVQLVAFAGTLTEEVTGTGKLRLVVPETPYGQLWDFVG
jgi:hypothetical protein